MGINISGKTAKCEKGGVNVKQRMLYREQKFECGDFLEVNLYPVFRFEASTGRRGPRKPTRDVQVRLNVLNRARECNRTICANFTNQDYYLTLTYKGDPPEEDRAKQDIENFLAKVARLMKKKGLPKPKWIKAIEKGTKSGRIHAHLVHSGGLTPRELQMLWGHGYIDCKPLMFTKDGVFALSRYFTKEIKNHPGDGKKAKGWTCSRNCIRAVPKINDYKYSKKRAAELARERENARLLDKLHPGYICAFCKTFYNDESGLYYLQMGFYKKNVRLDI